VRAGRRVLAVQVGHGRLGDVLGAPAELGLDPVTVGPGLQAAAIEPEEALGDFVERVLRLRVLARRLLESTSFQVVAAAAPGLPEFLVLQQLQTWLDARRLGRRVHDCLIVDAPASGHSLPLLAAPRTLGALAHVGPVAEALRRIGAHLADPDHTTVCVVTTPEELAVRETIELHAELTARLGLPVGPPIVNAVPARRFGAADATALERFDPHHPHVVAARFLIARREEARAQIAALRKAVGAPVALPFLYAGPETDDGLATLADELVAASDLAA
jgi:hypothetical protein